MARLDVWIEAAETPIGSLGVDDDGATRFVYSDAWLGNPDRHALSLSLPLTEQPFGDVISRAFFGNLLQENDQLEQIIQREGLGRDDLVGLLAHVGADCAGAVSVLPRDHPPIKRPGDLTSDYDPIDDAMFAELVRRLARGQPLPDGLRDPSPVAGYRRKITLAALPDGRFALPKAGSGAPTTHILKIPDPDHRHEARHEAFVTQLAENCGLPVGHCIADEIEGQEILLISRFDRLIDGDRVHRIHQEDFAQASGLPADLKYERRGREGRRFDAATIGTILAATDRPAVSRDRFLRATLFNLLIGNNDNHAKNHALLYPSGGAPTLAPFYDLVPVQMVAGFVPDLAFRIGAASLPDDIQAADLLSFAEAIGLPPSGAKRILTRGARDMIVALEGLGQDFPAGMRPLDNLVGEIAGQIDRVLALGLDLRPRDAHVVTGGGWQLS
jgi:serine/threonine-protein kinase HipA